VPIRTSPASSACSPQARARRITGTNPAHDTRFGSSKRAWARDELCNNRIYEVPYPLGFWKLANSHHPSSEALPLSRHDQNAKFFGGSRLSSGCTSINLRRI
jgi:hypothetical protein